MLLLGVFSTTLGLAALAGLGRGGQHYWASTMGQALGDQLFCVLELSCDKAEQLGGAGSTVGVVESHCIQSQAPPLTLNSLNPLDSISLAITQMFCLPLRVVVRGQS